MVTKTKVKSPDDFRRAMKLAERELLNKYIYKIYSSAGNYWTKKKIKKKKKDEDGEGEHGKKRLLHR